jgi:hypothetical protein
MEFSIITKNKAMKNGIIFFLLIISIDILAQDNSPYIKRIGEYSDTSNYYYQYSSPFSFTFRIENKNNIKIEFWSLNKKNNQDEQAELLDHYKINDIKSGKYLFIWNNETKIKYKGRILFMLYYDEVLQHYVKFVLN